MGDRERAPVWPSIRRLSRDVLCLLSRSSCLLVLQQILCAGFQMANDNLPPGIPHLNDALLVYAVL